ncbi:hypothetical protein FQS88_04775 [Enterococcus casseliflavus]|nr:hypothetical protein [Enterococcus casseliflavus]
MKKKVFADLSINVLSNLLLIFTIQLIVFPILSRNVDTLIFGQIISIYGFGNVITTFLGNSLNNIRLIDSKDEIKKVNFANISIVINILSFILSVALCFLYGESLSLASMLLFSLSILLANNRTYCTVFYRKKLKFSGILYLNIFVSVGYLIGLLLNKYFMISWSYIFLLGEIAGVLYLFASHNNVFYEIRYLNFFMKDKNLLINFCNLSSANLLSNVLNYLDRFLLLPILGAFSMSIFYAASSASKIFTMLITPMTNVLLSYIAHSDYIFSKKKLLVTSGYIFISLIPIYFVINFLSSTLVRILYPSLADESIILIPLISIGILLNILGGVINPFLIKFYKIFYQNVIQFIYGAFFITMAIYLSKTHGLYGYSIAFSSSMTLKLIIQLLVLILSKPSSENNDKSRNK